MCCLQVYSGCQLSQEYAHSRRQVIQLNNIYSQFEHFNSLVVCHNTQRMFYVYIV